MALAWAHCFFFSPCVCPLSSSHTHQPPPSPGHSPEAACRVPGAEAAGSESHPEAQAQQGRGVRARGALSTGEHLLGLPDPSRPIPHPRVPPSSALCPSCGAVWLSQLCEARSGPPSCPLAGLPSVLPSFLHCWSIRGGGAGRASRLGGRHWEQ